MFSLTSVDEKSLRFLENALGEAERYANPQQLETYDFFQQHLSALRFKKD
jgi:hypothetical protein